MTEMEDVGAKKVYVLTSDVGLNGYIVHGVYDYSPGASSVAAAEKYAARFTGYQGTWIEEHRVNQNLPCGSQCTRQKIGTRWMDCYCQNNGLRSFVTKVPQQSVAPDPAE